MENPSTFPGFDLSDPSPVQGERQATPGMAKWTPAAGRITGLISINYAKACSNEGETERTLAGLGFEGYRQADSVIVDGLKISQNEKFKMDLVGEMLEETL